MFLYTLRNMYGCFPFKTLGSGVLDPLAGRTSLIHGKFIYTLPGMMVG